MSVINVNVNKQRLTVSVPFPVADALDYFSVIGNFTDDWEGMSKWLHIRQMPHSYAVAFEGDDKISATAHINFPFPGEYELWVHGANESGVRITTNIVKIMVENTGDMGGQMLPNISLSETEQIDLKASRALAIAVKLEQDAASGAFDGATGPRGPEGPVGPQGVQGPAGPQGIQGERGPQGVQGPQGLRGPQGATGETGKGLTLLGLVATPDGLPANAAIGDAYSVGEAEPYDVWIYGVNGWFNTGPIQGPQGEQGEPGPQGPQGSQGPQGPEGPQGPKGDTGPEGPVGPQGEQGIQGVVGPPGPTGETGPAGNFVPNLLDNWYFLNAVNQNRSTSYSGTNVTSIDRWELNGTYDVSTGALNGTLTQTVRYDNIKNGDVLTASIALQARGGVRFTVYNNGIAVASTTTTLNANVVGSKTFTMPSNVSNMTFEITGTDIQLKAVKLEHNNKQTLSRAVGNNEIIDAPNYDEMSAICRRVYVRYPANTVFAYGCTVTATLMRVKFDTGVKMTGTPTINLSNASAYGPNGAVPISGITSINSVVINDDSVVVTFTPTISSGSLSAYRNYVLCSGGTPITLKV